MRLLIRFCFGCLFALFAASVLEATHARYYVLDGFGGVHAGGGAPVISPTTPYFGFDIAKDMVFVSGEAPPGYLVLDGFGGVHIGGGLGSVVGATPYFGFDIARAITYRALLPRANFNFANTPNTEVTSATPISILSTTLMLPDDGYVLIVGNLSMGNNSTAGNAEGRISVGVDGTTELDSIDRSVHMAASPTPSFSSESVIHMAFLTAGTHTFNLLVRKASGPGQVLYFDPTISAIYIDHDSEGFSIASARAAAGPTGPAH